MNYVSRLPQYHTESYTLTITRHWSAQTPEFCVYTVSQKPRLKLDYKEDLEEF